MWKGHKNFMFSPFLVAFILVYLCSYVESSWKCEAWTTKYYQKQTSKKQTKRVLCQYLVMLYLITILIQYVNSRYVIIGAIEEQQHSPASVILQKMK